MTDLIYLDSSALMRWACGASGSTVRRDLDACQHLEELLAGTGEVKGSPITIAEFTSVLYDHVRTNDEWGAFFGAEHADACMKQLMEWLSDGSIVISPLGRRAFEMGMAYVGSAAALGRRMRGWDAIHLYEACRWSREVGHIVNIATTDSDFEKTLSLFPEFGRFIQVINTTKTALPSS